MYAIFKRLIDLAIAIPSLVVMSPVMVAIAIAIKLVDRRNAFFTQKRPGLYGKPFRLIKFQTMRDVRDKQGGLLPDDQRLTKLGAFLRQSSLDELPSLWNVINGEMSLVGPRPLLTEYLPYYSKDQHRRHHIKPGLTGWAQIHGRNATTWEDRFQFDLWYVDNHSLTIDLKILIRTVNQIFRFDENRPTRPMPKFSEIKQS